MNVLQSCNQIENIRPLPMNTVIITKAAATV